VIDAGFLTTNQVALQYSSNAPILSAYLVSRSVPFRSGTSRRRSSSSRVLHAWHRRILPVQSQGSHASTGAGRQRSSLSFLRWGSVLTLVSNAQNGLSFSVPRCQWRHYSFEKRAYLFQPTVPIREVTSHKCPRTQATFLRSPCPPS
jgi:hypothetical protein